MKLLLNFLLVTVFMLCVLTAFTQTRADKRALRQRGNDSAWIYNPAFGQTRFYLGTTRVSPVEFENALRSADKNVNNLIEKARRKRTTGLILEGGGLAMGLVGLALLNNNYYYSNASNNTGGIILTSAGLGVQIAGTVIALSAFNNFRQSLQLFNYKARKGQLEPLTIEAGTTSNGIGLVLRF